MSQTTTTTVDPDGDIILEVSSPQDEGKASFLVSSKILSLASPVFARMLGPDFKEGSRIGSTTAPTTVRLPEDNATAMEIFCQAIHHQISDVRKPVTPVQLESLALLCDKYDCTTVLKPWTTIWVNDARGLEHLQEDSIKLFFAAYVFDIPEAFSALTWKIAACHGGPITALKGLTECDILPDSILGMYGAINISSV